MLKKRVIFTLLYANGNFVLSRNFRLQKVGNLEWLQSNYNFSQISYAIDELIVLDVTRGERYSDEFCSILKKLAEGCFIPISAGGGVQSIDSARKLLCSGADKVVVNSGLYKDGFVKQLASEFGQQSIVASMDVKNTKNFGYQVLVECGSKPLNGDANDLINQVLQADVGEVYLNSMNQDGTGQGCDFQLLDLLPIKITKPLILAGGVGNADHLASALRDPRVDAVATANLFNFIGEGLKQARSSLISKGLELPLWDLHLLEQNLSSNGSI